MFSCRDIAIHSEDEIDRFLTLHRCFDSSHKALRVALILANNNLITDPYNIPSVFAAALPSPYRMIPVPRMPAIQLHRWGNSFFTIGGAETQGRRPTMEDVMTVAIDGTTLSAFLLDGHGGRHVAVAASQQLMQRRMELSNAASVTQVCREINASLEEAHHCGSTMVGIVMTTQSSLLMSIGDSNITLFNPDNTTHLRNKIHSPTLEQARIMKVCGCEGKYACPCVSHGRVDGMLAVSRAFGDLALAPKVIVDPEVLTSSYTGTTLLCCDGVTDVLTHTEIATILQNAYHVDPAITARILVATAYRRGSEDNISAMVIRISQGFDYITSFLQRSPQ